MMSRQPKSFWFIINLGVYLTLFCVYSIIFISYYIPVVLNSFKWLFKSISYYIKIVFYIFKVFISKDETGDNFESTHGLSLLKLVFKH